MWLTLALGDYVNFVALLPLVNIAIIAIIAMSFCQNTSYVTQAQIVNAMFKYQRLLDHREELQHNKIHSEGTYSTDCKR